MTVWFALSTAPVLGAVTGGSLWTGGSLVAGLVALLAPCCVSVMLPAYLSAFLQNRWRLVAMTFVGGALLVTLGLYTLLGGRVSLPMPHLRQASRRGPLGIYGMGVVAGLASACCAPVLAGVVAISGLAPSFLTSLALGLAYVTGMVGPLFVMALFWDRIEPRLDRITRPRTIRLRLGSLRRELSGTALASGLLILVMGGATLWMAASGEAMVSTGGWEANFAADLNHIGHVIDGALAGVPGFVVAAVLAAVVLGLFAKAGSELGWWGHHATTKGDGIEGPAGQQVINGTTSIEEENEDADLEQVQR